MSEKTAPRKPMNNTLKCVLVLTVISVVCVALLAVANKFMRVGATLDQATVSLINKIAPTGASDSQAMSGGRIKMVDLSEENYDIKSIDDYNKKYGTTTKKVRALYASKAADGTVTLVVEAEGKGYVDAIVMLIAYDSDGKVSALVTKSQSESYWNHIKNVDDLYAAFVGSSGTVNGKDIASVTHVTVSHTLGGMSDAVSIANDFISRLGGAPAKPAPYIVTDPDILKSLKSLKDGDGAFTCYTVGESGVDFVYLGNGATIVEASGGEGYGKVTLRIAVSDGKVDKLTLVSDSFEPIEGHDSAPLRNEQTLNSLFAGKTLAEVSTMNGSKLPGTTGVTQSGSGILTTVKNALNFIPSFDKTQYGEVA